MFNFFFGTALVLFGLPLGPDDVFLDGFDGVTTVYISTDRPPNPAWAIDSTNHSAAIAAGSSVNYLTDGKVAIPTRFTWDAGVQSYTVTTFFQAPITGTYKTTDRFVFAALCPKTAYALPVGAQVLLQIEDSGHTPQAIATGFVVKFNNGATGFIGFGAVANNFTAAFVTFAMYNSLNGSTTTWATAGQTVDVGEVWFGTASQFNLVDDPKVALIDPTQNRRSHSNQPWPLFIKPYKQWTFNFTPMSNTRAWDSSSVPSFDSVRYNISQASCGLFLPRVYKNGTTTIDPLAISQFSCFGKPDSVAQLAAVKGSTGLWTASAVIGEAPP